MWNSEPFETAGRRIWELAIRWMLMAVAVWASTVVPGVGCDDGRSLLAAALILGILNALVKPGLVALTLPLVVVTLGLALLLINTLLLLLTARLVPGFHVAGFWPAMGASLIISLVSMLLGNSRFGRRPPRRSPGRGGTGQEPSRTRTPPPGKGPIIDV